MKIKKLIQLAWELYCEKVTNGLLLPHNEKMMQLQIAQILQLLAPLYETHPQESIKVSLEHAVKIHSGTAIIDIVLQHEYQQKISYTAIELKCYRLYTSYSTSKKRGAQNYGMYDYWADIENCEQYCSLENFIAAYQLTLTDDPYYVTTLHRGNQVAIFSTHIDRKDVTGELSCQIPHRKGLLKLNHHYDLPWKQKGDFYFIQQLVTRETLSTSNLKSQ